jgi:hypothetical protein
MKSSSDLDKMHSAALVEVVAALEKQMSVVKFFAEPESKYDPALFAKLAAAPLGNLGCESEFAHSTNALEACRGSAAVATLSMKAVVHRNKHFESESFKELSFDERMDLWSWCKRSEAAKSFEQLYKDYLAMVKAAKELAVEKRKALKQKQAERLISILDKCRKHNGPLAVANIDILDIRNKDQVLLEISLVRAATDHQIRQRKLVRVPGGQDYFETFELSRLKESLRHRLMPESNVTFSVEELLADVYSVDKHKGERVGKKFVNEKNKTKGLEWFGGKVVGVLDPGVNAQYQVIYDDGDKETVSLGELSQLLLDAGRAKAPALKQAQPTKKRKRKQQ